MIGNLGLTCFPSCQEIQGVGPMLWKGALLGDHHAWKSAKDGSGAVGCIDLPLGRFAAGFLFVSVAGTLANATICRFCGCFFSKWMKC